MKQNDTACPAAGKAATVLAAPGYCGSWPSGRPSQRMTRAFIIAAARAGADAVELDASAGMAQLADCAREHGLLPVARVNSADDISTAADAGIDFFFVDAAPDASFIDALAGVASCTILNNGASAAAAELAGRGVDVVTLHPHDLLVQTLEHTGAAVESPAGCELAASLVPAAAGGVLAAASGACVIRQRLALARSSDKRTGPQALSQKKFKEMVDHIRAAERILGRSGPRRLVVERSGVARRRDFRSSGRPAAGERSSVVSGQIVANITAVIDFAAAPRLRPDALELLLSRLERARNVDATTAVAPADLPPEIQRMLAFHKAACYSCGDRWLAGIVRIADETDADVIVWLPAQNVLVDPDLLDRTVVQHVKSAADYTICPDLPRGLAADAISTAALRRIAAFTEASADSVTTLSLLSNRRVFRVHQMLVPASQQRPDLDLTWCDATKDLFDSIVRTGSETTDDLIGRFSIYQPRPAMTVTEAGDPHSSYSFVSPDDDRAPADTITV